MHVSDSFHLNVIDSSGKHVAEVLSNNWGNTEYQRELMLSYGMKNLRLVQVFALHLAVYYLYHLFLLIVQFLHST